MICSPHPFRPPPPQILTQPRIRLRRITSLSQALAHVQTHTLSSACTHQHPAAAAATTFRFSFRNPAMSNQGKQRLYTGQRVSGFCSVWSFKEMPTFLGTAHSWVWMQTMPLISCAMADMRLNLCKPRDRHLDNGMKSPPPHGVVVRGKTENVWLGRCYGLTCALPKFLCSSPNPLH